MFSASSSYNYPTIVDWNLVERIFDLAKKFTDQSPKIIVKTKEGFEFSSENIADIVDDLDLSNSSITNIDITSRNYQDKSYYHFYIENKFYSRATNYNIGGEKNRVILTMRELENILILKEANYKILYAPVIKFIVYVGCYVFLSGDRIINTAILMRDKKLNIESFWEFLMLLWPVWAIFFAYFNYKIIYENIISILDFKIGKLGAFNKASKFLTGTIVGILLLAVVGNFVTDVIKLLVVGK